MAYQRTRESFKSMTGVSFDPLSAVSTASEMTLSLLLNPERMNRLVIQSSLSNSGLQNMSLNYCNLQGLQHDKKWKYERYIFSNMYCNK